jgi:hypothetical protein
MAKSLGFVMKLLRTLWKTQSEKVEIIEISYRKTSDYNAIY